MVERHKLRSKQGKRIGIANGARCAGGNQRIVWKTCWTSGKTKKTFFTPFDTGSVPISRNPQRMSNIASQSMLPVQRRTAETLFYEKIVSPLYFLAFHSSPSIHKQAIASLLKCVTVGCASVSRRDDFESRVPESISKREAAGPTEALSSGWQPRLDRQVQARRLMQSARHRRQSQKGAIQTVGAT